MAADPLEPVSIDAVFQNLRDRLEAFEAAFRQGPVGAQQVVDLWEKSLELKIESEEFYQFLLNYRTILNGLLWAHYPEEYREKVLSPSSGWRILRKQSSRSGCAEATAQNDARGC